jgi:hypothetical protein
VYWILYADDNHRTPHVSNDNKVPVQTPPIRTTG